MTSFWRINDDVITSCVRWDVTTRHSRCITAESFAVQCGVINGILRPILQTVNGRMI